MPAHASWFRSLLAALLMTAVPALLAGAERVTGSVPANGGVLGGSSTALVVTCSGPLDPATVDTGTVHLMSIGSDGREYLFTPTSVTASGNQIIVELNNSLQLADGAYRLRVRAEGAGRALSFDGTGQVVTFPLNDGMQLGNSLTWETWFSFDEGGNDNPRFIDSDAYALGTTGTGLDRLVSVGFGLESAGTYQAGTWHHAALVAYQDGRKFLFVDGDLVGQIPLQVFKQVTSGWFLGRSRDPNHDHFKGRLDELRLWSYPRSQAEIRANMKRPLNGTEIGLVGYWRCDEDGGQTLVDTGRFGHPGTFGAQATAGADDPLLVVSGAPVQGVRGTDGELLADGGATIDFRIERKSPQVTVAHPWGGLGGIPPSNSIAVTFTEEMDHAATEAAFFLTPAVPGRFSWQGNTLIFDPRPLLAGNTTYTVTVKTTARDLAGNRLLATFRDSFKTAPLVMPFSPSGEVFNLLGLGPHLRTADDGQQFLPIDEFAAAGRGPQQKQQPVPGQSFVAGQGAWVWDARTPYEGHWGQAGDDHFCDLYMLYLVVPTTRQGYISYYADDFLRIWLDGADVPLLDAGHDAGDTATVTLTAGIHPVVVRYGENVGESRFDLRFRNADGSPMSDLSYTVYDLLPPTVTVATSASGAPPAGTATWSDVDVVFSEPVVASVAPGAVATISGAAVGGAVGTWAWVDATRLRWTASAPLANGTTYTVAIAAGLVEDCNQNPLAAASMTFTTAARSAPAITAITPATLPTAALAAVELTGSGFQPAVGARRPEVRLSRAGQPDRVAGAVTVDGPQHLSFAIDLVGAAPGLWTVVLTNPDGATATLPGLPVSDAPILLAVTPADRATEVDVWGSIDLRFSQAMYRPSVEAAFVLTNSPVGTFLWSDGNTRLRFVPSVPLRERTGYVLALETSAKDAAGNHLATRFRRTFTTGAADGGSPLAPGPLTRLVHLGTAAQHLTGRVTVDASIDVDDLLFAGYGPEQAVQGHPGAVFDLGATLSAAPLAWTVLNSDDGTWAAGAGAAFRDYSTLTLQAATGSTVRLSWRADGNLRIWLDGAATALVAENAGAGQVDLPLAAGLHRLVVKYEKGAGTGGFSLALDAADGGDLAGLRALYRDVTPPTVQSSSATGAAVEVGSDILLTFSEPLDTSVPAASVATLSGGVASGSWSWTDRQHLCWTPAPLPVGDGPTVPALAPGTTYTVTLAPALVRDLAGNPLGGSPAFAFTTATPRVVGCTPAAGAAAAAVTIRVHGTSLPVSTVHPPGAVAFAGHHYQLVTANAKWTTARTRALARGGHLATITSAAENGFVWQLGGRSDAWIGLNNRLDDGAFVWDDGTSVSYTNWTPWQPDNSGGVEHFASFWGGPRWNDASASRSQPYVCEYDTPRPLTVRLTRAGQADRVAGALANRTATGLDATFDLSGAAIGYWTVVVDDPAGAGATLVDGFYVGDGINEPPTFTGPAPLVLSEGLSPSTFPGWVTAISPGPPDEAAQSVAFIVSASTPWLFPFPPSISSSGTLTIFVAPPVGTYTITITARDSGGTAAGGRDTSAPFTTTITVKPTKNVQTVTMGDWQPLRHPLLATLSTTATAAWNVASGPGSVTFGSPASPSNPAVFPENGSYLMRLTVTDGPQVTRDVLRVLVSLPGTVLVDNSAAPTATTSFTTTGKHWTAGPLGYASTPSIVSGFGAASAAWSALLPAGWHHVSWWKTVGGAAAVPLTGRLEHADGTATIVLDGDAAPAGWYDLGMYRSDGTTPLRLTITHTTGSLPRADAVRFIQVPGQVIDLNVAGGVGYGESGAWSTSTLGRVGVARSTTRVSRAVDAGATWTAGIGGEARVLLWRVPSVTNDPQWNALLTGDGAPTAYDIDGLGGLLGWADLGRHAFAGNATLTLAHPGSATLRADALRLATDTVVGYGDLGYSESTSFTAGTSDGSRGKVRVSTSTGATARWRASLAPGRYRASWWRVADPDSPTKVQLQVTFGRSAPPYPVMPYAYIADDLTTGTSGWATLGDFDFTEGAGEISISRGAPMTSAPLRVEAVRFEPLGDAAPVHLRPGGSG